MPCFKPMTGYRSKIVNKSGKRSIVFNTQDGYADLTVNLPCGQCHGCRLDYSRDWAIRCIHEAQLHENNSFITLTYNNENLPEDKSIHKKEIQTFFKRLRKEIYPTKIRYFACGEYGDEGGRPHYHAILFGYDFPDKTLWKKTKAGEIIHRSKQLEKVWTKGYSSIGNVTFESAAYVARYIMKKAKGNTKENEAYSEKYNMVDAETGELHRVQPEFCLMSRRPGIARYWLDKYKGDTDKDYIVIKGKKVSIPKYYDNILEHEFGEDFEPRKEKRIKEARKHREDQTWQRLEDREKVKKVQTQQLKRGL